MFPFQVWVSEKSLGSVCSHSPAKCTIRDRSKVENDLHWLLSTTRWQRCPLWRNCRAATGGLCLRTQGRGRPLHGHRDSSVERNFNKRVILGDFQPVCFCLGDIWWKIPVFAQPFFLSHSHLFFFSIELKKWLPTYRLLIKCWFKCNMASACTTTANMRK